MNPWLADEYDTANNIRRLLHLQQEKVAGIADAFLMRHGIGPGQGGVLQQILFPMLSQASSWTLRDSTANIPSWVNQFRLAEKGPRVFNEALQNLQGFAAGGLSPQQVVIPGLGPVGPG
jgi:hypothetical protein